MTDRPPITDYELGYSAGAIAALSAEPNEIPVAPDGTASPDLWRAGWADGWAETYWFDVCDPVEAD